MNRPENSIITGNGNVVNLINPTKEQIFLEDISSSLSKTCRYAGGTIHFYSVAQHSLNCYKIAREKYDAKTGLYLLLHDATEAYIGDIPTPFKHLLKEVESLEMGLARAIFQRFQLESPRGVYLNRINEIDSRILANEIPIVIPKLASILPEDVIPYSMDLDFEERNCESVQKEFEDEVKYLVNKI